MRYRFSDGMYRSADGKRFPKRKSLDDLVEVVFVDPPKPKRRVLVWECRIEVPGDSDLPSGADAIPRQAALDALELAGVQILGCESGWQPFLTKTGDPSTFGGRAYAEGKEWP
jgi:hypothetical protein